MTDADTQATATRRVHRSSLSRPRGSSQKGRSFAVLDDDDDDDGGALRLDASSFSPPPAQYSAPPQPSPNFRNASFGGVELSVAEPGTLAAAELQAVLLAGGALSDAELASLTPAFGGSPIAQAQAASRRRETERAVAQLEAGERRAERRHERYPEQFSSAQGRPPPPRAAAVQRPGGRGRGGEFEQLERQLPAAQYSQAAALGPGGSRRSSAAVAPPSAPPPAPAAAPAAAPVGRAGSSRASGSGRGDIWPPDSFAQPKMLREALAAIDHEQLVNAYMGSIRRSIVEMNEDEVAEQERQFASEQHRRQQALQDSAARAADAGVKASMELQQLLEIMANNAAAKSPEAKSPLPKSRGSNGRTAQNGETGSSRTPQARRKRRVAREERKTSGRDIQVAVAKQQQPSPSVGRPRRSQSQRFFNRGSDTSSQKLEPGPPLQQERGRPAARDEEPEPAPPRETSRERRQREMDRLLKDKAEEKAAAVTIQARFRCKQQKQQYSSQRDARRAAEEEAKAVAVVQSHVRGRMARRNTMKMQQDKKEEVAGGVSYAAMMRELKDQESAVLLIQHRFRDKLRRRNQTSLIEVAAAAKDYSEILKEVQREQNASIFVQYRVRKFLQKLRSGAIERRKARERISLLEAVKFFYRDPSHVGGLDAVGQLEVLEEDSKRKLRATKGMKDPKRVEPALRTMQLIALTPFDPARPQHVLIMQTLWMVTQFTPEHCELEGEHWKSLGFQNAQPSSDLRGMGMLSLLHMLYICCPCSSACSCTAAPHAQKLKKCMARRFVGLSEANGQLPFAITAIALTDLALSVVEGNLGSANKYLIQEEKIAKTKPGVPWVFMAVAKLYGALWLQFWALWTASPHTFVQVEEVKRELLKLLKKKGVKAIVDANAVKADLDDPRAQSSRDLFAQSASFTR